MNLVLQTFIPAKCTRLNLTTVSTQETPVKPMTLPEMKSMISRAKEVQADHKCDGVYWTKNTSNGLNCLWVFLKCKNPLQMKRVFKFQI